MTRVRRKDYTYPMQAGAALPRLGEWARWIRVLRDRLLAADPAAEGYASEQQADRAAIPVLGAPDAGDFVTQAYEAFQREIHSFVLHATRDAETAADVTQDAYVRLFREATAGHAPDNVRAWLYRVASNLVINRARHLLVVDRLRQAWRGEDEYGESPEQHALRSERSERLRAELERLPRDARVGLLLAANGFSGREVASAIGRSELATRSLLCRARLQIRERLEAEEGTA